MIDLLYGEQIRGNDLDAQTFDQSKDILVDIDVKKVVGMTDESNTQRGLLASRWCWDFHLEELPRWEPVDPIRPLILEDREGSLSLQEGPSALSLGNAQLLTHLRKRLKEGVSPDPKIDRLINDGNLSFCGQSDDIRSPSKFRTHDIGMMETDQTRDKEMIRPVF
jgi:hypothetical protein